jgi:non-heme Fe2+,alpha-ketoglutarate-dependent halogenase
VTGGLTTRQLEQYERDGVVFPVRVLPGGEAAHFRGALEAVASECGGGATKRLDNLHLFFGWAHRLATRPALLDAVESVLGDDILIDGTLVFRKPPKDSGYVSWHQDSVYSGWHLTPSVSAWVALTESRRANGCMRVIPGSHKLGLLDHADARDESNMLFRGETVAAVDESLAEDVVLLPGEMSLHHSTLIHGSNPNTSDEPRIGFIVRFVTSRVRDRERPLMRVRGEADCRHLTLAPPPPETDGRAAVSAWRDSQGV